MAARKKNSEPRTLNRVLLNMDDYISEQISDLMKAHGGQERFNEAIAFEYNKIQHIMSIKEGTLYYQNLMDLLKLINNRVDRS